MTKLNALIVDDEHSGRVSLKILLRKDFNLLFDKIITASSLSEALSHVSSETFDLCFLDIELGNKSGFELMPHLPAETKVIFVTAYSEYAIKAIKEKAFDYLLKPINPAELATAIKRYEQEVTVNISSKYLLIKDHGFTIPVYFDDIHHIEANGPYSKICLINHTEYTTAKTLKLLTEMAGTNFIRIHKSYTVNKSLIKSFNRDSIVTTTNICLPVSRIGSKVLSQYF